MKRGDGSTSSSQRSSWSVEMEAKDFHDNIGNSHSQGERRDRNQVGQSTWNYSTFPRSNLHGDCKKNVWKTLKDQLKGQESYTKIYLLTLLYTTKLEEGSLDVDGYVKSMEAIWRRLNDVNLKLPEELVILMTFMGLPQSFETQRRILESQKDLCMEIINKRPATRSFKTQS